jgi:hypothetical protein
MMFRKAAAIFGSIFLAVSAVVAQDDSAMRDVQIGMQGLMEATKDPEVLAQLMKDMQDPELMAEAKKMMENPEWVKKMKEMTKSKEYQESIQKTKEHMADPSKAAQAEAKFEHMARVGNEKLKKNAAGAMDEAIAALSDPKVLKEMTEMMQDPKFQSQMAALANDSKMKDYMDALKDMMKDPEKKKMIEGVASSVKTKL